LKNSYPGFFARDSINSRCDSISEKKESEKGKISENVMSAVYARTAKKHLRPGRALRIKERKKSVYEFLSKPTG